MIDLEFSPRRRAAVIAAAALATTGWLAADAAPSAALGCDNFRHRALTGDDPSAPMFALTDAARQSLDSQFGIDRDDFADEPGGLSTSNFNGSYRRLLDALLLIGQVSGVETPSGGWSDFAADRICDIEPVV